MTPKGKVVHELKGLNRPGDADRLPNGHTLIAQRNEVSEYDVQGQQDLEYEGALAQGSEPVVSE